MRTLVRSLLALAVLLILGAVAGSYYLSHRAARISGEQLTLIAEARQAGVTSLTAMAMDDGGLRLDGKLAGRAFHLIVPWRWNRETVLWANGYTAPGTWNSVVLSSNPLTRDSFGMLRTPYERGFAVGESAYDKSGMGVESAIGNTYRLKQLVDRLGSRRAYMFGASMGGNITMGLIEKYPQDFAGAIAACGVVGDWPHQVGRLMDVRATYNYFTRGTPYELPGHRSIAQSALTTFQSGPLHAIAPAWMVVDAMRLRAPVLRLFAAARASPGGPEDRMLDNIVAVSGTVKDPAAILVPLATLALGQDDMNTTFGGMIYDNTQRTYSSPHLNAPENAALNRGIERVRADAAAVSKANEWYKPTGRFSAKLISLYNAVDPLVPSDLNEGQLREAVTRTGNTDNVVFRQVPSKEDPHALGSGVAGLSHCGFTPEQVIAAANDVIAWVENGVKPQ
jgi:pimeloyl-ACP methyl ester carboxylesterase